MKELEIKIPASQAKSYKINIGTDILGELWPRIEADFDGYNKFVVTDENLVSAGHLEKLLGQNDIPVFVISPPGEISKNIDTAVSIIETMEKAYLGRDTLVIALGGGTVGDIAGFAAAVFKRGVPVIQIPTTTVAQADSAVGGKTGVDSTVSKNAFGAFWHPSAVYIDVAALTTLDDRQFKAGLVESVKHALIAESEYFDFLESNLDAILKRKSDVLEKVAHFNCKIKGDVVETDPYEQNKRRILNYGHTIGHAVETASGFELLHGEAVAIGIIGAGLIEIELKLAPQNRLERIRQILEKLDVPVTLPGNLAEKDLIDLIKHDKKAVNKWPRFVLLSDIGKVYCPGGQYAVEVVPELLEKVLKRL
ncbi:MAG: 3-dehydroquinate synthase [Planctomycetes bacterium]|nr:3-dehydroquinate synthase [Planctomycetota bacterium]